MRGQRHNLACRPAGFTLIELVLVLAVLALAAGLAAPTLRNFVRGREAGHAARQFVSVAQWARSQAITRGETYRINVDLAERSYWLTVQRQGKFDAPGEEFGRKFYFPDNVTVDCDFPTQPDGAYVQFQSDGRTDEGNLRFTSSTGQVFTVGCLSNTDQFQIYQPGQAVPWGQHHAANFIVGGDNP